MRNLDILEQRSILCAARLRFSPHLQPYREQAVDSFVKQYLLVADTAAGAALRTLKRKASSFFPRASKAIAHRDLVRSLQRLVQEGQVDLVGEERGDQRYRLSLSAREQLSGSHEKAEQLFREVTRKLFEPRGLDPGTYGVAFGEILCEVFSELGKAYVRVVAENLSGRELLSSGSITATIRRVSPGYPGVEAAELERAFLVFFQTSDPQFDTLKWNIAQHHYLARAIGIDRRGLLLSRNLFGNATFYLDTNVVIQAVEDSARHHSSFDALSRTCSLLGTKMRVCQISLDELERVVSYHRELIPRVARQVPGSTAARMSNIFLDMYRDARATDGDVDCDALFSRFDTAAAIVRDTYGIQTVDDMWFRHMDDDQATLKLADSIREEYRRARRRPKGRMSAKHDALMLLWVQEERQHADANTWFVTLDASLTGMVFGAQSDDRKTLAIGLDALLQWISPVASEPGVEEQIAGAFAEALRYHLLRDGSTFALSDFLVFAELEWECEELPPEDVEGCLRELRVAAPELDPSNPADLQKLERIVRRYFADPSRKYKQTIAASEREYANELADKDRRHEGELERVKNAFAKKDRLRDSGWRRFLVVLAAVVLYEVIALGLVNRYVPGANLVVKAIAATAAFAFGLPVGAVLLWLALGVDRIEAMGPPFTRFLKR